MAPAATVSQTQSVQTLPRLLAINKDFTGLDAQIEQATHIIGLPKDWTAIREEQERSQIIQRLVRARAEWVLRWILDKLKDEAEDGIQARANSRAWNLLEWMVQVLPTSRSATQLRDADFLSILERTLHENFENDAAIHPAPTSLDAHSNDTSESSETVQEDSQPSRKRKRPSSSATTSSKRLAVGAEGLEPLFEGIVKVVRSIIEKASVNVNSEEIVHTEHMRMALRTESAQAARILKGWLAAVNRKLEATSKSDIAVPDACLDLSLVLEIWELRAVDTDDQSGASADQFSTECLIPSLVLYNRLQDDANSTAAGLHTAPLRRTAAQNLERMLATHLFAPSRSAFFAEPTAQPEATAEQPEPKSSKAEILAGNLEPLRAKILQAAQIQDASLPIPSSFILLFNSIPQLLDMAIRMSPSRTPRSRVAERPWIQAVFVTLAECAGCPLEAPEFSTPELSLQALEKSLKVLALHDIRIDTKVLADVFWFHCGVKFPLNQKRQVQWSLIGALIKLDPDTFVSRPKTDATSSEEIPDDLAEFLFDQITAITVEESTASDSDEMDIDGKDSHSTDTTTTKDTILTTVVIPVLSAFARNRDLLGFINRWDDQLCAVACVKLSASKELSFSVWEDRKLGLELARLLEKSLTPSQIVSLFHLHAGRVKPPQAVGDEAEMENTLKAFSSAVLLRSLLGSLTSDELIESLEPQMRSLLASYTDLVQDESYRQRTDLSSCWITLCQLLALLWPIHLHASFEAQKELIEPLINQASKDISALLKNQGEHRISSKSRAAALLFLLTSCDHLRTVSGWEVVIRETLSKALKALSPTRLESTELAQMVELLCTEFVPLLEYLTAESRNDSLLRLLTKIAGVDQQVARLVSAGLSQSLFAFASPAVKEDFSAALLEVVDQNENKALRATAEIASVQIRPSALARDRREAVLDKLTEILVSKPQDVELLLSVMNSLQEAPNATSRIQAAGNIFFEIAQSLHDNNCESPSVVQLFQELVLKTLGHMLPNKDQTQNKQYLEKFQGKLASTLKKAHRCFPAKLAILRATFLVQKEVELLPSDQYLGLLTACLNDPSVSGGVILTAFDELPVAGDVFTAAQSSVKQWLVSKVDLKSIGSEGLNFESKVLFDSEDPIKNWVHLLSLLAKFRLYPDIKWFIELSTKLLRQVKAAPDQEEYQGAVLKAVDSALSPLSLTSRLDLVSLLKLQGSDEEDMGASYRLLHVLVSTLEDNLDDDDELKKQQSALLPTICSLLANSPNTASFYALVDTVDTIVREKHTLTSQHSIESLIATLSKLSSRNSPNLPTTDASAIFTRLCETTRFVLLLHRGRLGGRFHLLLPLLQNLLFCLFIPHAGKRTTFPSWLQSPTATLTPANASQYTRVLSTLCSPTQSSVTKSRQNDRSTSNNKSSLNDPVKAAREYVSHYIYPLLASLCRFQLNGRLKSDVREKLMPGVWEAVGTASMDRDSLEAMFAGLDKSSRELWRGVWEEWKKDHGRGQGV